MLAGEDEAFDAVVAAIERSVQTARETAAPRQPPPATPQRTGPSEWEPGTVFRDLGSFVMGSPDEEKGRDNAERPQHKVTFAQRFALGSYPG